MEVEEFQLKTKEERLRIIVDHCMQNLNSQKLQIYMNYWNNFYCHYPGLIIRIICDIYGVSLHMVTSRSKKRECTEPRLMYYYYFLKKQCNQTLVGEFLGRDHATALHGRKVFEELLEVDKNFQSKWAQFQEELKKYEEYL